MSTPEGKTPLFMRLRAEKGSPSGGNLLVTSAVILGLFAAVNNMKDPEVDAAPGQYHDKVSPFGSDTECVIDESHIIYELPGPDVVAGVVGALESDDCPPGGLVGGMEEGLYRDGIKSLHHELWEELGQRASAMFEQAQDGDRPVQDGYVSRGGQTLEVGKVEYEDGSKFANNISNMPVLTKLNVGERVRTYGTTEVWGKNYVMIEATGGHDWAKVLLVPIPEIVIENVQQ